MTFSSKFISLGVNSVEIEIYSLYLNEVRTNLAAPGKLLLRCSTNYVPVGDLDRSPLLRLCIGGRSINLVCHIFPEIRSLHKICGPGS